MLKLLRKLLREEPRVIVLDRERLDDKAIEEALAGNSGAIWYKAIVSKIDRTREDNILQASIAASSGNTLAMAGGLNAYEALTGLLNELDGFAAKEKL